MSNFGKVLIAGTGPAAVQLAVLFGKEPGSVVAIAGRDSVRAAPFFCAMLQSGNRVRAEVQNAQHQALAGECVLERVFLGYETVEGEWDTLILAVAANAYIEVLRCMPDETLRQVRRIVLLSPTFGSNHLVCHYMAGIQPEAEVISFSTYLGDTRWAQGEPSERVLTTGMKRKLYVGSSSPVRSSAVDQLCRLYGSAGIVMQVLPAALEAETRNISLYVHPPLFMNEFSLDVIFGEGVARKFVYKMFPEGPITQQLICEMLSGWREMTAIMEKLGIPGVNLLQFMIDDNYPVRPESLSRQDIEQFMELEPIHQQYLLYVRYTSLLIDPFSEPDEDGRYFDFSAVPFRQIYRDREGCWDVPRMPKEDDYRVKIIQGIARYVEVECPVIDRFIARYEQALMQAASRLQGQPLSDAFAVQDFAEDVHRICSGLGDRLQGSLSGSS